MRSVYEASSFAYEQLADYVEGVIIELDTE